MPLFSRTITLASDNKVNNELKPKYVKALEVVDQAMEEDSQHRNVKLFIL